MDTIKLKNTDTRAPKDFDKAKTKEKTEEILEELDGLQNLLYAESKHSVLIILQGMDGSGKDGLIRKVLGNMNPQGVMVTSYKVPTEEELSHDFLWRIHKKTPAKGMIQVFNRSHYEDVLVTRVHKLIDDTTARKRMDAINDFEKMPLGQEKFQKLGEMFEFIEATSNTELFKKAVDAIFNFEKQIPEAFKEQVVTALHEGFKEIQKEKAENGLKDQADYIASKLPKEKGF